MNFDELSDGQLAARILLLELEAINSDTQREMERLLDRAAATRRELVNRSGEQYASALIQEIRIALHYD